MPDQSDLLRSPAWFPLSGGAGGGLLVIELDEPAYRLASFLDERLLTGPHNRLPCAVDLMEGAAAQLSRRAHYLFHIGHVGSTLLSRLLGEHPALFSLREPALLRGLADARLGPRPLNLHALLALLSRTWNPGQRALIKTTSVVNELSGELLQADPSAVAIMMFAQPLDYLRGILAGANSRRENQALARARWSRLVGRLGSGATVALAAPRGDGEQAAMSWVCEMTTLRHTAAAHGGRIQWVDFDTFLRFPESVLHRILDALGLNPTAADTRKLLLSPWMQRYSKAPEHAYDADLRRRVLASADAEHGPEIRRGLTWLEHAAVVHADIAALFDGLPAGRAQ